MNWAKIGEMVIKVVVNVIAGALINEQRKERKRLER